MLKSLINNNNNNNNNNNFNKKLFLLENILKYFLFFKIYF